LSSNIFQSLPCHGIAAKAAIPASHGSNRRHPICRPPAHQHRHLPGQTTQALEPDYALLLSPMRPNNLRSVTCSRACRVVSQTSGDGTISPLPSLSSFVPVRRDDAAMLPPIRKVVEQ